MKSRSSVFAFAPIIVAAVSALAALNVTACSDDSSSGTPAEPLVEVPEVPSSVAVDALCDLSTKIQCAGGAGCCGASPPFASENDCLDAYASCSDQITKITGSALFKDGTITYDPTNVAAMLKELADSTSDCETKVEPFDLREVFVGSLADGADCSPKDQSGANALACAPGLSCNVTEDENGSVVSAKCGATVTPGAGDDTSTPDLEPTAEGLYCAAPPEVNPPSNADIVPTALSINTRDESNAGTTHDVTLHFIQKDHTTEYYCTITGGVTKNTTKTCSPVLTRTWSEKSGNDLFFVENDSTDGLCVDSVAVCTSGTGSDCSTSNTAGTFDTGNENMVGGRITWAFDAFDDGFKYFYVDDNDNGNCTMAKVNFNDDNKVNCSDHSHP